MSVLFRLFLIVSLILIPATALAGSNEYVLAARMPEDSRPVKGHRDLRIGDDGEISIVNRRGNLPVEGIKSIEWYQVQPENGNGPEFEERRVNELDGRPVVSLRDLTAATGGVEKPGTYRFRAVASLDNGERSSTPGGDQAFRLTFRRNDTYLGWLETFRHVPYKFGSSQREVKNHLAADCADFVVGGYQKMGGARLGDMGTVTMLAQWRWFFDVIHNRAGIRGGKVVDLENGRRVSFGRGGVKPGDIVLYKGHVGVITRDSNRNGHVDPSDPVIHSLWAPPRETRLENVWTGDFNIIRWKNFTPWQKRLRTAGLYNGPADGIFNAKVEKALVAFQKRSGLKPDALPGPKTWSRLKAATPKAN